jgi:hypothetical protein
VVRRLLFPVTLVQDDGRQAKIADLDLHVMAQKNIAELQVTMDDLVVVHERARFHDLPHVVSHLWFCQSFAPLDHFHEGLV